MDSAAAIAAAVAAASGPLIPTAGGTKSGLAACEPTVTRLDLRSLSGIVSYEASEFLISALGGTPISDLRDALAEHGQYLPFDPMFVSQGATLGGTVASGLSGAGQLLYGSLRDFVMEVELVDGLGKIVRGGAKVVKNAAGFDLPKLMVGSYGRLGILTEVTLKVFPQPQASATLTARLPSMAACATAVQSLLSQPLPISSLDLEPTAAGEIGLWSRFSGPVDSLPQVLLRGAEALGHASEKIIDAEQDRQLWKTRGEKLEVAGGDESQLLIRISTTLDGLQELYAGLNAFEGATLCSTGGGATTWLSLLAATDLSTVDQLLSQLQLAGVVVRGPVDRLMVLGEKAWLATAARIQKAIDPDRKFLAF